MWNVDLAKLFKERDNKNPFGAILGDVIGVEPLKIAILGNKAILTEEQCYLCSSLVNNYLNKADLRVKDYSVNVTATDSNGDTLNSISVNDKNDYNIEVKFKEVLKVGDKVLCLPTADGQTFFIIDKVVV